MRKVLLFAAALLVCHAVQAQYFCTVDGTELHYVNYDEAGQSVSNVTIVVQNAVKDGANASALYQAKIVTNKSKNNTSYTRYGWSYDGKITVCREDLAYGPYIKSDSDPDKYDANARKAMEEELKFKGNNAFVISDGAQAGQAIPDRSYSVVANMLKNEVTVSGASYMGEERVSTTAGRFDCVKVQYLQRTKILLKSETLRITEWYAQGIGLVKSESYDMKGEPHGKTLLVKVVK